MLDAEYVRSLDDEILKDVYYYHNKINNIVDLYTVGCEVSEWDGEKKRAVDAGKGLGGKSQACMVEMRQGTFLGNRGPGAVWRRGMPCLRQSHASQGDK